MKLETVEYILGFLLAYVLFNQYLVWTRNKKENFVDPNPSIRSSINSEADAGLLRSVAPQPRISSCRKLKPDSLIVKTLNKYDFVTDPSQWDLHITCKDDFTSGNINQLSISHKKQQIMGIHNKWVLGSKKKLWQALEKAFGRKSASLIMPKTYVLTRDLNLFIHDFDPSKTYLLKKDIQRQKGIELTNNLERIKKASQDGYIVVQEYLKFPYLYRRYKTNLRVYMLVVCRGKSNKEAYIYHDGIISYGGQPYSDNQETWDQSIASFYASKHLYQSGYPITWVDFRKDLPYQGQKLWESVKQLLKLVMKASHPGLCQFKYQKGNTSFELFGADFFISNTLKPFLIEINVGPGMVPYNQQDEVMRSQLYEDMFHLMGLIPDDQLPIEKHSPRQSGFQRIWATSWNPFG